METIVSGTRPTGHLHLGNYFGAVSNFVKLQDEHNCFFFVADYHSLTTHPNAKELHQNVKSILIEYLACGLNPEKSTLYIQSDIPEIPELYLILNMLAYKGELERCNTFKEKVRSQKENINAGLLTYPVLQAADILIHKATKVPVGKDQKQHLEMTRDFVNRFNHLYSVDIFPEPQAYNYGKDLIKIPGLDGSGKMGKSGSEGNAIYLVDDEKVIRKRVMRAVTDSGPTESNQAISEPIQNLFTILEAVGSKETVNDFKSAYANCTIRYGDLKNQVADDIIAFTRPIKERIKDIESDEDNLKKILKLGTEKARASASKTLSEVRRAIGIKSI